MTTDAPRETPSASPATTPHEPPMAAPDDLLEGVRTVLLVHAHPDDETLWTGNLMAELVDRGVRTVLVTTNRGELGQVVDPQLAHLYGTPELGPHRARELAGALGVLGVTEHAWLGTAPARAAGLPDREYGDSGMCWVEEGVAGPAPTAAADPRCFTSAPLAEAVADLRALIESVRPDAIVTYDERGGYGHPDHVRAHEIAVAAGRETGVPVWAIVIRIARHATGTPDVWFDLPQQVDRVREALRHYRTQLVHTDDGQIRHEDGFTHPVPEGVGLARVV